MTESNKKLQMLISIPDFIRVMWLFYMQPLYLQKLLMRRIDSSEGQSKGSNGQPINTILEQSDKIVFIVIPTILLISLIVIHRYCYPIDFLKTILAEIIFISSSVIIATKFTNSSTVILVSGQIGCLIAPIIGVILQGASKEETGGVVSGCVLGLLSCIALRLFFNLLESASNRRVFNCISVLIVAIIGFWFADIDIDRNEGLKFLVTYIVVSIVLYFALIENVLSVFWVGILKSFVVKGQENVLARLLPFRHLDLLYFPLPGLCGLIIEIGRNDPILGNQVINEAAESIGQKTIARNALAVLQSEQIKQAALDRLYARTANLDFSFMPDKNLPPQSPLVAFQTAARELKAAEVSLSYDHRGRALTRAGNSLEKFRNQVTGTKKLDILSHYLFPVSQTWLEVIANEHLQLDEARKVRPQVPTPFVPGAEIGDDHRLLFKGRKDLVQLIDHDVIGDQRAPLFLLGQRRMGKSSLLRMLPVQLGAGTLVAPVDFQKLSGSTFRSLPHRMIAESVSNILQSNISAPTADPWGPTFDWLKRIDGQLVGENKHLLITVDEVERLQDGIRDGWGTTDFLDFVRAAGDELSHIRFLLVSAHPLWRLGNHWIDRLISAIQVEISYLESDAAEELVRKPVPDFPAIYPEGGTEAILSETHNHPYLIQLICDEICRHLNSEQRLKATMDDVQKCIDNSFGKTSLFDELWRQQDESERIWLKKMVEGGVEIKEPDAALKRLVRLKFVENDGFRYSIAVPMFTSWIASNQ